MHLWLPCGGAFGSPCSDCEPRSSSKESHALFTKAQLLDRYKDPKAWLRFTGFGVRS